MLTCSVWELRLSRNWSGILKQLFAQILENGTEQGRGKGQRGQLRFAGPESAARPRFRGVWPGPRSHAFVALSPFSSWRLRDAVVSDVGATSLCRSPSRVFICLWVCTGYWEV